MSGDQCRTCSDLLWHHRHAACLTQAELAERAGLSRRGINDLERGVRQIPRKDTVALLVEALGLDAEERTAFVAAARKGMEHAAPAASTAAPPTATQGEVTASASALPTGTVTFLFTDLEGSTRLLQQLEAERYAQVRAEHERLLRAAFAAAWRPPSPDEIMRLVANLESQYVQNGDHLLDVVSESLARLQTELTGDETPGARDLWARWREKPDTMWRPLDEPEVSDYVRRHLRMSA
jgi:transcriptional regulator with XRE-family HTH domain